MGAGRIEPWVFPFEKPLLPQLPTWVFVAGRPGRFFSPKDRYFRAGYPFGNTQLVFYDIRSRPSAEHGGVFTPPWCYAENQMGRPHAAGPKRKPLIKGEEMR